MKISDEKLVEYIHDLINKSVSTQAIIKILERSEFDEKQAKLLSKAKSSVEDSLKLLKDFREEIKVSKD